MGEEEQSTTETKPLSGRDIRVSDAEREHVVEVLQKAIGLGMLNLDEFTERTDRALASRTRGELNAVLTDLPGLVHPEAGMVPRQQQNPWVPPSPQYPYGAPSGQPMELNGKYSALQRNGNWLVPESMVIRNKYGATKLDFSQAEIRYPVVYIELQVKWGSVELTIPENGAVDTNSITDIKFGSLDDRTGSNGRPGTPRFIITGRVHGGTLIIKYPRRGFFG
ncbi:DUF1707 SHOCT-like domain-containing protein [Amycolatopsis regifaucium]|uniref:DUF1707 domain-containing protein n=1 Tax=Amycolatopsis regifaucium TaxID=546365 RepID=A0A154MLS3_9PSEU|nr:DUF1707 domain-containing protein [Amycolatopsis regifaucium]KZB84933.1 hypothetical protein AVL48_01610 [Amycolatopsis regifaucium]OKA03950.1 hypothetical protein ATP06_0232465 [Amycolatopsis regifaucium]SFH99808.1 protein of unknown function [Amycolatopsis regifaucium]